MGSTRRVVEPGRRLPRRARRRRHARSSSASAPGGSRCRSQRAASRSTGIDLSEAMVARLRAKPGGDAIAGRRSATSRRRASTGTFSARLPRLQHDQEPDHAGRAGRVLRERRRAPRARRLLRDRGRRPGPAAAAARRALPGLRRQRRPRSASTSTTSRRRACLAPLRAPTTTAARACLGAVPLRVAGRARPDGADRRHAPARALGGLGARAVHRARARSTSRSGRRPSRRKASRRRASRASRSSSRCSSSSLLRRPAVEERSSSSRRASTSRS